MFYQSKSEYYKMAVYSDYECILRFMFDITYINKTIYLH